MGQIFLRDVPFLDRSFFLMPPLFVNEMGSRLNWVIHIHGKKYFRELLNWIHEQDLCFYLNRLDKLLTKVGSPQTALAYPDSTRGLEEAATYMLPQKDEMSTKSEVTSACT